jgi:N-acetylglutamate synthase
MRRPRDTVRAYRDAFTERDRVYELEGLAARAWPPLTILDLDGWQIRTSRGLTRRGNSVWPRACGDRLDFDKKLANVERYYAFRELPPTFQLGPTAEPKGLDRALADRGYRRSEPVEVRVARVDDIASRSRDAAGVLLFDEPGDRWLDAWARAGGHDPDTSALALRMLARVPAPSKYALLHVEGADIAVGRGVLDGGWLGVAELTAARGWLERATGRILLAALCDWAAGEGAEQAWLAAAAGNVPMGLLSRDLGFRRVYTYHYRSQTRPEV